MIKRPKTNLSASIATDTVFVDSSLGKRNLYNAFIIVNISVIYKYNILIDNFVLNNLYERRDKRVLSGIT